MLAHVAVCVAAHIHGNANRPTAGDGTPRRYRMKLFIEAKLKRMERTFMCLPRLTPTPDGRADHDGTNTHTHTHKGQDTDTQKQRPQCVL